MQSTTAAVDLPVREKAPIPTTASVDNANANGAPPPAAATTAPSGDGPVKLTALELKAQKKAEKAAKRQQVIQNRQGGAASGAPAGAAAAILSPQGNKASQRGSKESGKGQHKRAASSAGDSKNAPARSQQNNAPVEPPAEDKTVELFRHLYKPRAKTIAGAKDVHPAVLSLGQQMSNYVICGSNARLVATLRAFKRVCIHKHHLFPTITNILTGYQFIHNPSWNHSDTAHEYTRSVTPNRIPDLMSAHVNFHGHCNPLAQA